MLSLDTFCQLLFHTRRESTHGQLGEKCFKGSEEGDRGERTMVAVGGLFLDFGSFLSLV